MTLAIHLAQDLISHTLSVPQRKEEGKSFKRFGRSISFKLFSDEDFDNSTVVDDSMLKQISTVVDDSMLKQILNRPTEEYLSTEIDRVLIDYGQENWDGEGALAITPQTADVARSLLSFFSLTSFSPDVDATPHGEIDFDFSMSENTLLTVRSCPSGKVVFSGTFREGDLTEEMSCFMKAFFKGINSTIQNRDVEKKVLFRW